MAPIINTKHTQDYYMENHSYINIDNVHIYKKKKKAPMDTSHERRKMHDQSIKIKMVFHF